MRRQANSACWCFTYVEAYGPLPDRVEHSIRSVLALEHHPRNYQDCIDLHGLRVVAGSRHPGLCLSSVENDPTWDLTPGGIARVVSRLEAAAVWLVSQVYVLNHWR